jgi:acetyl-CoA carboxylase biotin carboxyl carrier protein
MKIEEIKVIVKLMSENDLTEFKIEADECNLCIKRGSDGHITQVMAHAAPVAMAAAQIAPVQAAAAPVVPEVKVPQKTIDSPIVGTFYRSPSPDAKPFVNIGDRVNADTVVCIIEAMKVLNEIKAEKSGVITEIMVENATPVEFGQPLFVIA